MMEGKKHHQVRQREEDRLRPTMRTRMEKGKKKQRKQRKEQVKSSREKR